MRRSLNMEIGIITFVSKCLYHQSDQSTCFVTKYIFHQKCIIKYASVIMNKQNRKEIACKEDFSWVLSKQLRHLYSIGNSHTMLSSRPLPTLASKRLVKRNFVFASQWRPKTASIRLQIGTNSSFAVYEAGFIALYPDTSLAFLASRASGRTTGPDALGQKTTDTSRTPRRRPVTKH